MNIVTKRDGREERFNPNKIKNAIKKAFVEVDKDINEKSEKIIDRIVLEVSNNKSENISVEDIQDIVEKKLMQSSRKDVAKSYILYRNERTKIRNRNNNLVQVVMKRVNSEIDNRSNANVDEKSFSGREKEASSDIGKIIALDYDGLSEEVSNAHKDMLVYQHDLEKAVYGIHNCLGEDTKFITTKGIKTFKELNDGEKIRVITHTGEIKNATVKCYGFQPVFDLTFKRFKTIHHIKATNNHRWLLKDGTWTDNIKVGDYLAHAPNIYENFDYESLSLEDKKYWCYGFVMGDGTVRYKYSKKKKEYVKASDSKLRLCGNKIKYKERFSECGFTISTQNFKNNDVYICGIDYVKTVPNVEEISYRQLCAFIHGLYDADGGHTNFSRNGMMYTIQFSNKDLCDFVDTMFQSAGLYISRRKDRTGNITNYGTRRYTIEYSFVPNPHRFNYQLINMDYVGIEKVWCLEVEDNNSFVLDGGIVTGNCLNLNFQEIFNYGFRTRNGDVRPPTSFSTACQLVAVAFQCQSQVQFGGVGTIHLDYDLAPFVRMSFHKHYKDGLKYIENINEYNFNSIEKHSIDNVVFKKYPKVYQYAMDMLEKEGRQAAQGLYHNLNTLESRQGSQVPFTSINLGRDTSVEGRLVTKWIMEASLDGIGKHHLTSIFPISIFQYKDGVNANKEDKNYDLKQIALKSMSKRIYPNWCNCDWSQAHEDKNDIDTMFATMGCVEGNEIITYRYKDNLYVESFKRMWDRLSDYFNVKHQLDGSDDNLYFDVNGVYIYDTKKGFVKVNRIIRNMSSNWVNVKMSHGRSLICTSDHPFHTNRGRVMANELTNEDIVNINPCQFSENYLDFDCDKAWLLGFILCDGCYDKLLTSSIALNTENDIEKMYILRMKKCFNNDVDVVERHRGNKGNYKDLCSRGNVTDIINYLFSKFEGLTKAKRHIPNEVFSWNEKAKLNFLAGMIDADGYINPTTHNGSVVQLGSTNKELALQQMALAQSLNMPVAVYQNHYSKTNPNAIRYRVEFAPSEQLMSYIVSEKKLNNYIPNKTNYTFNEAKINSVEPIKNMKDYSYDVETESDYFEVSGIYSHNCRTLIGYDRHGLGYIRQGRGNNTPNTIILPKLGIEFGICLGKRSEPDIEGFWNAFEETLKLTEKGLLERFEIMAKQSPNSAPFMYQNNTIQGARECKDNVFNALKHNTLAIGYIGIAEMCQALFGKNHAQDKEIHSFALSVVKRINEFANEASERNNLNFSCYATPSEGLCRTALVELRKQYGVIENITSHDYITNSHHVPVWERVSIVDKLNIEAPFCKYPTGGCITYIELDSVFVKNIEAVEGIIDYAFKELDIPYLAFNFPIDSCLDCGYQDEFNDSCPECGSKNIQQLRRVTGYLTTDWHNFNDGKQAEVKERVKHSNYSMKNNINEI